MSSSPAFRVAVTLALAAALVFLTVPVLAIFVDTSPSELLSSLGDPAARDALRLSLVTTVVAMLVIIAVGTPAAYALASREFRGSSISVVTTDLPRNSRLASA